MYLAHDPRPPLVAVILAAGVGSRLRPLTDDRPKCLVDLGGETILRRAVRLLAPAGVTRIVVSTGYLAESVRAAMAFGPVPVSYVHNEDYDRTQNVVSFARALGAVHEGEAVVKLDGDVVFAEEILRPFAPQAGASVWVDRETALGAEEMKVALDETGRVRRFGKGLDPRQAHGESIGIEAFAADAVPAIREALSRALAQGRTDVYYEDVYNDVLDAIPFVAHDVASRDWSEVDDLADLERAREAFRGR